MTVKKFMKQVIPPFLLDALKKMRRKIEGVSTPAWHTIKGGILKGRNVFIDPSAGKWQKDMIEGVHDRFVFDYLNNMDMEGKVVFDIGAHIGYHTLHFSHLVGASGIVCAFEPNNFNRQRLIINLQNNPDLAKRIRLFDFAISDKDDKEEFFFCRDVDKGTSAGSFLSVADTFYPKSEQYLASFEKSSVLTKSLDNISSTIGENIAPNVIKIDVEGAESNVLQGGLTILEKYRPIIIIEIHSIYNMLRSYEILQKASYKVLLLKEEFDGRCFIAAEPL